MKYIFLVLSFLIFLNNTDVFAQATANVPCGQHLQLQANTTPSVPVTACQVLPTSPLGDFEQDANGVWRSVPPEGQPPVNRTSTLTADYVMRCPNGLTSNVVTVTFEACTPSGGGYTLSAAPNPVQICSPATQGSTAISWTTENPSDYMYVYVNGAPSLVGTGNQTQSVSWIQPGQSYSFTLRRASAPDVVVAGPVVVTGTSNGCTTTGTGYCGDSSVQAPNSLGVNETCDLGAQNGQPGSSCSATCQDVNAGPVCGNGVQEIGEQCDLGSAQNGQSGSACSASCQNQTPVGGTQYYACTGTGTSACQPVPNSSQYATAQDCANAIGTQCRTTSNCDNICTGILPPNTYYRCAQQNSGQSCTANLVQCSGGEAGCFSANQVSQCATYCGSQRYTCAGGCQPCGQPGQLACTNGSYSSPNQCQTVCEQGGAISCGYTATPGSAPVGETVNLALRTQYPTGGTPGTVNGGGNYPNVSLTRCEFNTIPGATGGNTDSDGFWNGMSGALGLGSNTFNAKCIFNSWNPEPEPEGANTSFEVQCLSNAVTGTPAAPASVSCTPSPQNLSGGQATFNWSTSGFSSSPTCRVDGGSPQGATGSFTRTTAGTSNVVCTQGTQSASASCVAQNPAVICGDNICNGSETCSTCPGDCGVCTLGAECVINPTVQTVLSGRSFSVPVSFRNIGTKVWNPSLATYTARSASSVSGWNQSSTLTSTVAGAPTYGTFSPMFSFIAPTVTSQTNFSLSFRMYEGNSQFETACLVNGSGLVTVVPPECSDSVDNSDPEDALADSADPGCWTGGAVGSGTYDPADNNEIDTTPGVILKISANPQLVRQGGSSNVTYEVNNCTVLDSKGDVVPGAWELRQDGILRDSGTSSSGGEKVYPVNNIQVKTTFTLSCGGTTRSATISVIKINEI